MRGIILFPVGGGGGWSMHFFSGIFLCELDKFEFSIVTNSDLLVLGSCVEVKELGSWFCVDVHLKTMPVNV